MTFNPSSVSTKQKKELYAKALAQDLKAKGYNKIEYTEYGEGARGILVNDKLDIEKLSDEDIDTIDILIQTLGCLGIPTTKGDEPSGTEIFEGIEIKVGINV